MFVPMPIAPMPVLPQHFYNKYEKLDPEQESAQFVATEGTYKPIEEINVAYPAPHPSEPPPNPNPLTPYAAPLSSGMHLSILASASKSTLRQVEAAIFEEEKEKESPKGSLSDSDSGDRPVNSVPPTPIQGHEVYRSSSTSTGGGDLIAVTTGTSSVFDNNNETYLKRKRRTGTSANGTTSTFVSRAIVDPNLSTRLAEHKKSGVFVFANIARSLSWFDLGSPVALKHEPLSKLLFSLSNVVCHDINQVTSTDKVLEIVLGTTTGDICWYDPATTRYLRYNKQRCINATAVTHIQWLPGSENLFMAAHADGALVIYDKDREDSEFLLNHESELLQNSTSPSSSPLQVLKSAHDTRTRTNPVSYLSLSRQSINAFAFSPDGTHLALVSDDGCLKILDYRQERLLDVFSSYYGGLTCVTWSPDGQYIVTGGKDDIVSIWSFPHRCILARGHGHASWVSGVAFDPWLCDGHVFRIGSVSEDGKLCLWDLSLSSLHKPSARRAKHVVPSDPSTGRPVIANGTATEESTKVSFERDGVVYHRAESRLSTAILSPITVMQVDDQPPSHLVFLRDRIVIATTGKKYGRIKSWSRPDTEVVV